MKPSAPAGFAGDAGRVSDDAGGRAAAFAVLAFGREPRERGRRGRERGDQQQRHDTSTRPVHAQPHGVLMFQRCRSLSGLNLASVGMLLPAADSASGSFEFGTAFGIRR